MSIVSTNTPLIFHTPGLKRIDHLRVLVTGGAGFIGSNFIRLLLTERPGWEIVNFDLLTYAGNLESLEDLSQNPCYCFIKGDITSPGDVKLAVDGGFDIVVNFAAETHVDKSLYERARFLHTNILGTGILLEYSFKIGVSKFIQISTDEVYGSLSKGKADENDPLSPSSPYAASKAGADLLCQSFHKSYGLPIIITRSSNNYGPYQFPEKIIPFFISEATEGRYLPLYGTGANIRDWLYVEDNCRAILTLIDKGIPNEIYNIAGGAPFDNLSLTKKLLAILGKPESLIKFVEDRPGHDMRYA
ncbi:MAG TPA: dTDP-glucose 4,6-dehydratase, partial [candidate division Zixibacteria bacterium]|nr:dTDP-glucose 4,6-dehydratase [candidate division Zixibacteria bacterium]